MRRDSLGLRLTLGALLWIAAALVVSGFALAELFREHVARTFEARLKDQLVRIIALVEVGPDGGLVLARPLVDPRFRKPYSGWYWQIDGAGGPALRSRSLWDASLELPPLPADDGGIRRHELIGPRQRPVYAVERSVTLPGSDQALRIVVAADRRETAEAIAGFTRTLVVSLGVLGLGLLAAALLQVRLGLRPLRRLRAALADIRAGRSERLGDGFPVEVTPLVDELNGLLDHNAEVVARARTHVGNLAHALKTPLTVLANEGANEDGPLAEATRTQTGIMRRLIDHHLARARAAAAAGVLGARTDLDDVIAGLRRTLERIHAGRGIRFSIVGDRGLAFAGERQDLEEMLGNLMDNACKWTHAEVRVRTEAVASGAGGACIRIRVEDDGPGLAPAERARVFERGRRLDEAIPGTGFGLAIVRDLAELYGGAVRLEESELGGLAAELELPAG